MACESALQGGVWVRWLRKQDCWYCIAFGYILPAILIVRWAEWKGGGLEEQESSNLTCQAFEFSASREGYTRYSKLRYW